MLSAAAVARPTVNDARIGGGPNKTRFVLDVSERVSFQVFTLADPYRVVVDLPVVTWKIASPATRKAGLITDFRYGLFRSGVSRVVLDVKAPVTVAKSFLLEPRGQFGYRLVIDLRQISRAAFARGQKPRSVAGPVPGGPPPPVKLPPRRRRHHVIVLDPGHGGVDPGTTGVTGKLEKHIVLAFARTLKRRLEKSGRYRVVMTRGRDIYVPLRARIAVARDNGADLFLSLHADSLRNPRIRGGSIYTLSERASDKEAATLAAKENKADLIAGIDLNVHSPEVANILIDLAQRKTMNFSVNLAEALTSELGAAMRLLRNSRRFAGFAVLKAPDVPSVLIELGYLSNRADERLLADSRHRVQVAAAIERALKRYFAAQQAFKRP